MYIRKKANKHEGLCCIFTLREKLVIEKKKKKEKMKTSPCRKKEEVI